MNGSVRRRWLVDGMNVIGSRPDGWWNDPDRAVHRLVDSLDTFARRSGDLVTVVFDRRPKGMDPGSHGAVDVAFARRRGRNAADHEIVEIVSADEEPSSIRVVTSDTQLAERVRALGASVAPSGWFLRRLGAGD